MGPQDFEHPKTLLLILLLLLDKLFDKFFKLGFACFRDQGLLQENLVNQSVNVGPVIKRDKLAKTELFYLL